MYNTDQSYTLDENLNQSPLNIKAKNERETAQIKQIHHSKEISDPISIKKA